MLAAGTSTEELHQRMEAAVLAGEADISAGRTMSLATFEKRISNSLRGSIAANNTKKRKS